MGDSDFLVLCVILGDSIEICDCYIYLSHLCFDLIRFVTPNRSTYTRPRPHEVSTEPEKPPYWSLRLSIPRSFIIDPGFWVFSLARIFRTSTRGTSFSQTTFLGTWYSMNLVPAFWGMGGGVWLLASSIKSLPKEALRVTVCA